MAKSIYVGNLPWSATEEQVQSLFADYGPVVSVKLRERSTKPAALVVSVLWKWKNPVLLLLLKLWTTLISVAAPCASTKPSPVPRVLRATSLA